ncbi:hypothetical protein CHS0354_002686, partial [Potamilus streckersoni]
MSVAQITFVRSNVIFGGSIGTTIATLAQTLLPKILLALGTFGLTAASGAVSGVTTKSVSGDEFTGDGIKQYR